MVSEDEGIPFEGSLELLVAHVGHASDGPIQHGAVLWGVCPSGARVLGHWLSRLCGFAHELLVHNNELGFAHFVAELHAVGGEGVGLDECLRRLVCLECLDGHGLAGAGWDRVEGEGRLGRNHIGVTFAGDLPFTGSGVGHSPLSITCSASAVVYLCWRCGGLMSCPCGGALTRVSIGW